MSNAAHPPPVDGKPEAQHHGDRHAAHLTLHKDLSKATRGAGLPSGGIHPEPKSGIIKLVLLAGLVVAAALSVAIAFEKWNERQSHQERMDSMIRELKRLESRISFETTGYEHCRLSKEAHTLLASMAKADPANSDAWLAKAATLADSIEKESAPVFGQNFLTPRILLDMVHIPPGEFIMGRGVVEPGEASETPRRKVQIDSPFWISRMETTTAQFKFFYPQHIIRKWHGLVLDADQLPACDVTWHQADKFCELLTASERRAGRLPTNYVYRLPTEAEWEYACRAGTATVYYWNDTFGEPAAKFANSLDKRSAASFGFSDQGEAENMPEWDGYVGPAPVGSYQPNAFGLYDTTGNLWEWCLDWYSPTAYQDMPSESPLQNFPLAVDVAPPESSERRHRIKTPCKVLRGGSWGNLPSMLRSYRREWAAPESKDHGIGFRVVLGPDVEKNARPKTQDATLKSD